MDEETHRKNKEEEEGKKSSQAPKQEINRFDEFINIPKKEIHLNYRHTHTHNTHINIKTNRLKFKYHHSISILANISDYIAKNLC